MQQLLGDTGAANSALVRELFLQRLPTNIRVVLASAPETASPDELAQLTDRITDAAPPAIVGITPPQEDFKQLRAEVSRLTDLVSSLRASARYRSPTPHRRRPSPPHRSPHRPLCWYHERFGEAAQKCRLPCAMSGNDRPVTRSDKCNQASHQSPVLRYRQEYRHAVSGRYRCSHTTLAHRATQAT